MAIAIVSLFNPIFIYELLNYQSCKLANLPNQKFSRSQFSLYFISPILSTHVKTLK